MICDKDCLNCKYSDCIASHDNIVSAEKRREYGQRNYQKHKQKRLDDVKRWRKENPEKVKLYNHRAYLKRKAKKESEKANECC